MSDWDSEREEGLRGIMVVAHQERIVQEKNETKCSRRRGLTGLVCTTVHR